MDGFALNDSDFLGDFSRAVASCARSHHSFSLGWVLPGSALLLGQPLLVGWIGPALHGGFGLLGVGLWRLGLLCILASCLIACLAAPLLLARHGGNAARTDNRVGPVTVVGLGRSSGPLSVIFRMIGRHAATSASFGKVFLSECVLRLTIALTYFRQAHKLGIRSLAATCQVAERTALVNGDPSVFGYRYLLSLAGLIFGSESAKNMDFRDNAKCAMAAQNFVKPQIAMSGFGSRFSHVSVRALLGANADVERFTKIFVSDTTLDEGVEVGCHPAMIQRK